MKLKKVVVIRHRSGAKLTYYRADDYGAAQKPEKPGSLKAFAAKRSH